MTLLTLSSRQIWPQVLCTLHIRPSRLILFHSDEGEESRHPAERLKTFFNTIPWEQPMEVELRRIPHDNFSGIIEVFHSVAETLLLDGGNGCVNLTGGNKLMAMAAVEWCRQTETPCFYLERNRRLLSFRSQGPDFIPQPDAQVIDLHLARNLDPLGLLVCQLSDAEVVHPGLRLTLRENGRNLHPNDLRKLIANDSPIDFRRYLDWDHQAPSVPENAGDRLEFATALALLKLGVPVVQRGVHLRPRIPRPTGRNEGELDLVFNWKGKLWIVDCKDRRSAENRMGKLRTELLSLNAMTSRVEATLEALEEELRAKDLHPLKEDLLSISEVGGILGKVVCVRRTMEPQAIEYATSRRIEIILKDQLFENLKRLLDHP